MLIVPKLVENAKRVFLPWTKEWSVPSGSVYVKQDEVYFFGKKKKFMQIQCKSNKIAEHNKLNILFMRAQKRIQS
jgi:hypothetical protein